jgi:hypothetical protein
MPERSRSGFHHALATLMANRPPLISSMPSACSARIVGLTTEGLMAAGLQMSERHRFGE